MEEKHLHALAQVPLEDIVKKEYCEYQIYTLMDRAIPYLSDGLKPGQRRILYTLWKNQSKGLIKVSSATGLVLTLHPHGPASIETAIVNLAQDFSFANNYPLIDKKGYFGERMETSPAASRYIECKLGKVAEFLLFDDVNQVEMVPNYDETTQEPVNLLPKLPVMLLNGAEGIGTGFSSVIPSFHHSDICQSMIQYVETGRCKKLKPFVHNYHGGIVHDRGKYIFEMRFEEVGDKIFITEIPKGFDAARTYRHLNKFIESDELKDFIDHTVDNDIKIELAFKRGQRPSLEQVQKKMGVSTSMTPNYTLVGPKGVRIFQRPEEIVEIFTQQRLAIVKRRYQLRCLDLKEKIQQNNEIIKFIRQKEYQAATRAKDRKNFVEYLNKKKFTFSDYLADMPIYRMTKDEVDKRKLLAKEDSAKLVEYQKVAKSDRLVRKKLIEELEDIEERLEDWARRRDKERKELRKRLDKSAKGAKKSRL